MNYAEIKKNDIANGCGVRVSLFVSGCPHHCKGCFNEQTWDFSYGELFDEAVLTEVIDALAPAYVRGLTLLGGEPMVKENQKGLLPLLRRMKQQYPDKDVWCFTGYIFEKDILGNAIFSESVYFVECSNHLHSIVFLYGKFELIKFTDRG